jgi:hypothetical protein
LSPEVPEDQNGAVPASDGPGLAKKKEPGDDEVDAQVFLERARQALVEEGFRSTPMQYRKKDQVFGLVKDHGDRLQIHVRAFRNGVLESEVELSNRYIEHLWSPRRSAHNEIARILEKHGLDTRTVNTEFRTRTGADRDKLPRIVTPTRQLVKGAVGVAGAVGAVAFARYLQRMAGRSRGKRWGRG